MAYQIAFLGDTSFGENYQAELKGAGGEDIIETHGREWSLQKMQPFLDAADLVVGNLETPLTSLSASPYAGRKSYIHWSDPVASTKALKDAGIDVVSLGNNHTMDFGPNGLLETVAALDRQHIPWFGAGRSADEASRPYATTISTPAFQRRLAVFGGFQYRSYFKRLDGYAKGDAAGVNRIRPEKAVLQIEQLKRESPETFVVFFPHWGENYRPRLAEQQEIAHTVIDAGADLVIGHGAHMMGELERYHGVLVAYSIGNFVFNAPGRYDKFGAIPYSFLASLLFSESGTSLRLYPILSDNAATTYQPRFVTRREFTQVEAFLRGNSSEVMSEVSRNEDGVGLFFELRPT